MMSEVSLECGHCGEAAIYGDRHGLFTDGDGEKCISCGMPGQVIVDEDLCGDDELDNYASWSVDDEGGCNDPKCSECEEYRTTHPEKK